MDLLHNTLPLQHQTVRGADGALDVAAACSSGTHHSKRPCLEEHRWLWATAGCVTLLLAF